MTEMQLRIENQLNEVADDVSALIAVSRPILEGILYALKQDVVAEVGGYENVKLKMLPRLYRAGDGDCGICFEYAVHDAVARQEPSVVERVDDSLKRCKVPGDDPSSILFGAEKTGSQQLIDTAHQLLTKDSVLLYGSRGRPVKLRKHISGIATAMRRPAARAELPRSITGIWKADLFLGHADEDRWVGTTVKVREGLLEGARGLRVGIIPAQQGESDIPRIDEDRNLVICPLPYDGSFVEIFYAGWIMVKQFINADARVPSTAAVARPAERQVAKLLADRREATVLEVIEVFDAVAQPKLLKTDEQSASLVRTGGDDETDTGALVSPVATMRSS